MPTVIHLPTNDWPDWKTRWPAARELQALYAISQEINRQPDLPPLLRPRVEAATCLLNAPSGALYLMRPDGHRLELAVSHNLMADMRGVILQPGIVRGHGPGRPGRHAEKAVMP